MNAPDAEATSWGALVLGVLAFLGKIGWYDKRKPKASIHEFMGTLGGKMDKALSLLVELDKKLAVVEATKATKEELNDKVAAVKSELHNRISEHVETLHSKAA